jgi:hypothetical protein
MDGDYTLEYSIKNNLVTGDDLSIFPNSASVATDYWREYEWVNNTTRTTQSQNNNLSGIYVNATSQSSGTMKIRVVNSKFYCTSHTIMYDGVNHATWQNCVVVGTPALTTINSITLVSPTAVIGAGSRFKLIGSINPVQLIAYNPIDFSSLTSDRLLKPGEVAFLNFTSVASLPLRIQSEEGIYEFFMYGDTSLNVTADVNITLRPNNALTPTASVLVYDDNIIASGTTGTSSSNNTFNPVDSQFYVGNQTAARSHAVIQTFTKAKAVSSFYMGKRNMQSNWIARRHEFFWTDITIPWTSLGTIVFGSVSSGKVIVRRLI